MNIYRFPTYNFLMFSEDMKHHTNKIVLPLSIMSDISEKFDQMNYIIFKLKKLDFEEVYVSILNFTDENVIYVPKWIQTHFDIQDGDDLFLMVSDSLPKGLSIKIQAQSVEFLKIQDPCTVLEKVINNYTVLYKNQIVSFDFENVNYEIKITECQPSDHIDVVDIDLNIEFDEPVGYHEYLEKINREKQRKINFTQPKQKQPDKPEVKKFVPFSGKGYSLKD